MKLVYVDEAGIANPKHEPYVVVAASIVDADKKLIQVERYLKNLLKDLYQKNIETGSFFMQRIFSTEVEGYSFVIR